MLSEQIAKQEAILLVYLTMPEASIREVMSWIFGPVSEENLSARKMCPGGHTFLGNPVLPDRIYCLSQDQMSPCKISHCAFSTASNTTMEFTNLKSLVKLRMTRLLGVSSLHALLIVSYASLSLVSHGQTFLVWASLAYTVSDIAPYRNSDVATWDYSLSPKSNC